MGADLGRLRGAVREESDCLRSVEARAPGASSVWWGVSLTLFMETKAAADSHIVLNSGHESGALRWQWTLTQP